MAYYKHWTSITRSDGMFAAHCTGCDWNTVAATRPDVVRECRQHQHDVGERREDDERPPEERFKRRYYSYKVLSSSTWRLTRKTTQRQKPSSPKPASYRSERAA